MLIQNHKIINRRNGNKDSFRIADNDFYSSITDALPMTQRYLFKQRCSLIRLAMKLH